MRMRWENDEMYEDHLIRNGTTCVQVGGVVLSYTWCVRGGYYACLARCSGQSIAGKAGLRIVAQGCMAEQK